ncbi:MAG: N-acetylmuramoyl-L-alanine amidase [Lachnospiraceae bacterium]|nr:N-acetylmuramoyl-L-alanine amidase [Lachnospiraceae bacterium]
MKIRYNGKTYKNKSKKRTVKYNSKTVSKKSYKALIIKKSYMVPYSHVFKKGVNAKCSYSKKNKTLTISKNQVTITMKLGEKTATVNGKKVKLKTAPLSVRYVSQKKTMIFVPVSFVAENLHLSYKKSGSHIYIEDPLQISYDGQTAYYTGVQGTIYYNHKNYKLSSMPVIKLSGNMYMPAEETMDNILNLEYDYNASSGKITVTNEDLDIELVCYVNSTQALLNSKRVTLNAPVKIIKDVKKNKNVVCFPASQTLKQLNYIRSWNKKNEYYSIQSKSFFDWQKTLTGSQESDTDTNHIYAVNASYSEINGIGSINFKITGSLSEIMKTLTVKRSSNTITITIPKSKYLLNKHSFSNFGEIIEKYDATDNNDMVTITLTCSGVADYSYIVQNKMLELNVLYTYSNSSGSVTEYSLSIPKPANTTIANVSNQDLYASKKFQIIIQGNHVNFLKANPIVISNNSVKKVAVSLSGMNTVITVTTSSLRGYKIYERGNNFVVSMGAPKNIYRSIVVLDAGHGGFDPGAQHKKTDEKDLTHKIIYTLMKSYFSSNAPDIKVYWTRSSDVYVTLANRAAFAKSVGADAFISLHMNSASSSSANGTEVYYSVSNNGKGFGGITSKKMATLFKNRLINDLKTKNRGVKTAGYYVLKHNTVPAILIELGFLSGSSDYSKLTSASFQKKAAKSIYDGIVSMFSTYQTGR